MAEVDGEMSCCPSKKVFCIYLSIAVCSSLCLSGFSLAFVDVNRYNFGLYFALVAIVGLILAVAFCILTPESQKYNQMMRQYYYTFSQANKSGLLRVETHRRRVATKSHMCQGSAHQNCNRSRSVCEFETIPLKDCRSENHKDEYIFTQLLQLQHKQRSNRPRLDSAIGTADSAAFVCYSPIPAAPPSGLVPVAIQIDHDTEWFAEREMPRGHRNLWICSPILLHLEEKRKFLKISKLLRQRSQSC